MLGDPQVDAAAPDCAVEDKHSPLGWTCVDLTGEGGELDFEERDVGRRGQVEDGAARSGMDKTDQIAPSVAVLDWSNRSLAVETSDLVQDRLGADAVLVRA
jgi:hypothetical protein